MTTPVAMAPLRFGHFELQRHERRLLADGQPIEVGGRAFDLLLVLADRPGQLVSKRALMDLVWPGVVVEENNLAAQVSALRKLLGGDLIATIPGRGYRFMGRIASPEPPTGQGASPSATAPGPASDASFATNLPADLTPLLGRADDLAELNTLVETHRLVTIVGPGGIGKSLLTQHFLHARRGRYAQGVCWAELSVTDAASLAGTVASALGLHGGGMAPLRALIAAVTPLRMLLALDNAEHLIDDVSELCRVLHESAPGLHIVVTSQVPLRLPAERIFRIDPLPVPGSEMSAAQAQQFGAVALFVERARAVDRHFALTDSNAPTVIEICRAVDGLPVAIELAAARAPMLGLPRLLASMHDRLQVLTTGRNRDAPERQRTLRAALEWSHGFLEAREQRILRRLGVIAGSASLEFIQRLLVETDEPGVPDAWAVLDALDALVERSLVTTLPGHDGGAPRYRLLESTRAYALERLDEAGERESMQRRHASALAELFDAAYAEYFDGSIGAESWMRKLAADIDNARDALAAARASGEVLEELTIAATLLRALPRPLNSERVALADACEPLLTRSVPAPLAARMWIELSSAWGDTRRSRALAAAQRALECARALDREQDDGFTLYHALCLVAGANARLGRPEPAAAPLAEMQQLEDPEWPAQRLLWGAQAAQFVAHARGDGADVVKHARRLVELDRRRGNDVSLGLGNLVDAELVAGNAEAAARSGAALVAALHGTRHGFTLALARLNLCAAYLALDDTANARAIGQALWPQAVFFDYPHLAALYLALLAALEKRPRAAAQLLGYAEAAQGARHEDQRAPNESAAIARARAIAMQALGENEFARLHAEGARLSKADVPGLAFSNAG
ncbi:MAG TPA: winged helix-turn-helix domain-containing protein [Burkholderiaceae bacterium]|nr:winged helix-turn-helix domain-containing protein [Burkholderiaceae bacterium]